MTTKSSVNTSENLCLRTGGSSRQTSQPRKWKNCRRRLGLDKWGKSLISLMKPVSRSSLLVVGPRRWIHLFVYLHWGWGEGKACLKTTISTETRDRIWSKSHSRAIIAFLGLISFNGFYYAQQNTAKWNLIKYKWKIIKKGNCCSSFPHLVAQRIILISLCLSPLFVTSCLYDGKESVEVCAQASLLLGLINSAINSSWGRSHSE